MDPTLIFGLFGAVVMTLVLAAVRGMLPQRDRSLVGRLRRAVRASLRRR